MGFEQLRFKIDHIQDAFAPSVVEQISLAVRTVLASTPANVAVREAFHDIIVLDTSYAFAKHLPWVRTTIFQELFTEHLVCSFGVTQSQAAEIVTSLSEITESQRPRLFMNMEADSDRHFLRYVFIASATAKSEFQLVVELGLGEGILRRIKSAAAWIVSKSSQKPTSAGSYMPALDACFAETMLDFSRAMKSVPWVVDQCRLRYHLLAAKDEARKVVEEMGADQLFDLLFNCAHAQVARTPIEQAWFERVGVSEAVSITQVIATLCQLNLLSDSHERGFKQRFVLTAFAEELVADRFAITSQSREEGDLADIARLPYRFQSACIRHLPKQRLAELRSYIATHGARSFAPKTMELAFAKLGQELACEELARLVEDVLDPKTSGVVSMAILAGLGDWIAQDPVRQVVTKVAQSHTSPVVAEAARVMLLHRTSRVSESRVEVATAREGEVDSLELT